MTVKAGRYIFKRIRGRIIPIRIGAEAKTTARNFSMSALRKLQGHKNKMLDRAKSAFTDSSVVKEKVFHGTNAKFKKFNHDKIGSATGTGGAGRGFYFADKTTAKGYGKNIKEAYLNIKNPLFGSLNDGFKSNKITESQIKKLITGQDLSNFGERETPESVAKLFKRYNTNDVDVINDIGVSAFHNNFKSMFKKLRSITGIDGIIQSNDKVKHYIAFNSDQIMDAKRSTIYKDQLKKFKKLKSNRNK